MKSRNPRQLLTVALLVGAVPALFAAPVWPDPGATSPEAKVQQETMRGKIRQVSEESFVLMVDEQAHTIPVGEQTQYFLDGKQARKEQVLKVGTEVLVELGEGTATKVSARSKAD